MSMQLRIAGEQLTEEQDSLEDKIYEACELLKQNGYKCSVVKTCVFKETESPAYINFEL